METKHVRITKKADDILNKIKGDSSKTDFVSSLILYAQLHGIRLIKTVIINQSEVEK